MISVEDNKIRPKDHQEITSEDRQKLMNAFAWLIQEDKKQNPSFYQLKKSVV